jgi:hypothetical protein
LSTPDFGRVGHPNLANHGQILDRICVARQSGLLPIDIPQVQSAALFTAGPFQCSTCGNLIDHSNPIARVRHAAKTAAAREAEAQIRRLQTIDLNLETPHHRLVVRQWLPGSPKEVARAFFSDFGCFGFLASQPLLSL